MENELPVEKRYQSFTKQLRTGFEESTERRLLKTPQHAEIYNIQIKEMEET